MNTLIKRLVMASAVVGISLASCSLTVAGPIVTETVTGTSGNYTLDFTIQNTLNPPMDVYFFGVQIDSGRDIVGSPTGYDPNSLPNWNNSLYGGSNINYNNNWIDNSYTYLPSGSTLGGFSVYTTDAVAPVSVNWFAFAVGYANQGGNYTGTDYFNTTYNPGFEGVTTSAVPEPSTVVMAAIAAVVGLGALRRRRAFS
jgi:hypothetical protein